MCFSCCLLQCYQIFMRNQEGRIELQEKVHRPISVREITSLAARPPSYGTFCHFFGLIWFYRDNFFLLQKMVGGGGKETNEGSATLSGIDPETRTVYSGLCCTRLNILLSLQSWHALNRILRLVDLSLQFV